MLNELLFTLFLTQVGTVAAITACIVGVMTLFYAEISDPLNCGDPIKHCRIKIGSKVGRLTVQEIYFSDLNKGGTKMKGKSKRTYARCMCDCGNPYEITKSIKMR